MATVVKVGDGGTYKQGTMHMICDEDELSESQQKVYEEWAQRVKEYDELMRKHKDEEDKYQTAIRAVDTRVGLKDSDQIPNGPTKFLRAVPNSICQLSSQTITSTVSSNSVQTKVTSAIVGQMGNTVSKPSIRPGVAQTGVSPAIALNGRQQLTHGGIQLSVRPPLVHGGNQLSVRQPSPGSMASIRMMLQTPPQQQSSVKPAVVRPGTYVIQNGYPQLVSKNAASRLPNAAKNDPMTPAKQNVLNVSQRPKASNNTNRGVKRPLESSVSSESNKQSKHELDTKKLMTHYPFKKGKTIPIEERRFKIKCFHCNETMASNVQYATHVKKIVENLWPADTSTLIVCPRCFKRFRMPYELQEHLKTSHVKGATYPCFTCELTFGSAALLTQHMDMFHPIAQMPFYCQICEYRTSAYCDIIEHFSMKHAGYKALMCPYCLKMLRCSKTFLQHCQKHIQMSLRVSGGTFSCKNCKLSFLSTSERSEHVERDHKHFEVWDRDGVPRYVRDTLKSLKIMVSAGITVVGDPSSKVHVQYTFTQPASLGKKLACMECGLFFNSFSNHFGAKLYCDNCSYTSFCPRSLSTHMMLFHKAGKQPPEVHKVRKKTNADGSVTLTCRVCNYHTKAPTHMAHHCAKKCVQATPMEWMRYLHVPPIKKVQGQPSNLVDVIILDDD